MVIGEVSVARRRGLHAPSGGLAPHGGGAASIRVSGGPFPRGRPRLGAARAGSAAVARMVFAADDGRRATPRACRPRANARGRRDSYSVHRSSARSADQNADPPPTCPSTFSSSMTHARRCDTVMPSTLRHCSSKRVIPLSPAARSAAHASGPRSTARDDARRAFDAATWRSATARSLRRFAPLKRRRPAMPSIAAAS